MRVLLVQLDGKWPNVALMRLAAHHRERGDTVSFTFAPGAAALQRGLNDKGGAPDLVYGSLIFEWTKPLAKILLDLYPNAILGGSGWDFEDGKQIRRTTVEQLGVTTKRQDYSIYPRVAHSIGFTQRGCRLRCPFCNVPRMEPELCEENTVRDLWRGEAHARDLVLLDNDFFGQIRWRQRIREIRAAGLRVAFTQGINARTLTAREARAVASVDFRDDSFRDRRIYCAWDNAADGPRLFAGLARLVRAGIRPDQIMVYMLVGFWCGEPARVVAEDFERVEKLLAFGARPFPMPFRRTPELRGFARWVIRSYAKRGITWDAWVRARFQPRNLKRKPDGQGVMFAGVA